MYQVNDDMSIYVTRGDIVNLAVTAEDDGEKYFFQPGDVVRIKVFAKKDCETVVLQKDFPVTAVTDTVELFLDENDTKIGEVISKPKDYWYEVELNPETNPQTIIGYDEDGTKVFRLFPEGRDLTENDPVITPEDIPVVDEELDLYSKRPVENMAVTRALYRLEGYIRRSPKDCVTPEMFGAVGDGITDDTRAIQTAVESAISNKQKIVLSKSYYITEPIKANGNLNLDGDEVFRPTLTTDKEIDAILVLGETNGGLVNISNINFNCNGKCDGIKFGSSSFIYNKIDNVLFVRAISCIRIYNDGNTSKKAFYAHNIEWTRIRNYDCASIISQTTVNNGDIPWVYGGVIHDVDFEGNHIEPTENERYVMDLAGFRNLSITNLIFEGKANGNYSGVVYINSCCDANHMYFEIVGSEAHCVNSFVIDTSEEVTLRNIYAVKVIPILVKKSNVVKASFSYVVINQSNLLDEASNGSLDIEVLNFGSWHTGKFENDVISSRNKYRRLLHGERYITVDDEKPVLTVDFEKLSENQNYLGGILTIGGDHGVGTPKMDFVTDALYGKCLKVQSEGYNLAHCYFVIDLSKTDLSKTLIAVTYKCDSAMPHNNTHAVTGASRVFFDSANLSQANKYYTVLGTYNGNVLTFRPDYIANLENDSEYEKQSYTISDISVFKGFHYGSCKSKINTSNY